MKTLLIGLVFIMGLILSMELFAQSTGVYEIGWNALDETDLIMYHIYMEERDSANANFILFDGLHPDSVDIDALHIANIPPAGQSQYFIEVVSANDQKWVMVGILGQDSLGRIYLLGALLAPIQKDVTVFPGPDGIIFRRQLQ